MTSNGGCRRHVEPLKLRRWPRGRLSFGTMRHWLSCEMGIIGRKLPQESCINSCCNRFGYGKKCKNQISLHCVILILVSIRVFLPPATWFLETLRYLKLASDGAFTRASPCPGSFGSQTSPLRSLPRLILGDGPMVFAPWHHPISSHGWLFKKSSPKRKRTVADRRHRTERLEL